MNDVLWQQGLPLLPTGAPGQSTELARPDLGLDPLDFIELLLQVEQHFGIRFSAAELTELRRVQVLLDRVERPLRRAMHAQFFAQLLQQGQWL